MLSRLGAPRRSPRPATSARDATGHYRQTKAATSFLRSIASEREPIVTLRPGPGLSRTTARAEGGGGSSSQRHSPRYDEGCPQTVPLTRHNPQELAHAEVPTPMTRGRASHGVGTTGRRNSQELLGVSDLPQRVFTLNDKLVSIDTPPIRI